MRLAPCGENCPNPFDSRAEDYEVWFDSLTGRALFEAELVCLRPLVDSAHAPWLEVGVGTGRFAQALGVGYGLDPSPAMLRLAAARSIRVCQGVGEALPYSPAIFGGVLFVTTLCFVSNPAEVLRETARALRPGGSLVLGIVPRDSPWGQEYATKGREGHPVWSHVRLLTVAQVRQLAAAAGFEGLEAQSTLLQGPGEAPASVETAPGIVAGAGFVALRFALVNPRSTRAVLLHSPLGGHNAE